MAHLREEQLSGGLAASLPPETALPVSAPQLESPGGIFFISNLYEGGRALGASSRARAARQIPPPTPPHHMGSGSQCVSLSMILFHIPGVSLSLVAFSWPPGGQIENCSCSPAAPHIAVIPTNNNNSHKTIYLPILWGANGIN